MMPKTLTTMDRSIVSCLQFCSMLLLLCGSSDAFVASNANKDTCSYSFQVWKPEQNVLDKLRALDARCSNVSSSVEYQLLSLRNHVITEVMGSQNVTHRLERELLEQKLEYIQQNINLKDLKLDIVDVKGEIRKIWSTVQAMEGNVRVRPGSHGHMSTSPSVSSMFDVQRIETDFSKTRGLVSQLKNSVGDLKAEWLLIKREVNSIKTQMLQSKFSQDDLKADTVKLKSLIEGIKSQTGLTRNELDNLSVSYDSLQSTSGSAVQQQEMSRVRNELIDLRSRCDLIETEVVRLVGINEDIRQHTQYILSEKRNVTTGDLSRLLGKMKTKSPEGIGIRESGGDDNLPKDCNDVYKKGFRVSGVYQIQPDMASHLDNVYCEMVNHSGWTVLVRREDGTIHFNKGWLEYKIGFGSLYGEFWLGNDNIHRLTRQKRYTLRVDMWDWEGGRDYAEYDHFYVGNADDKFRLKVRGYKGTAGDSLSYHDDMMFSTEDSDNDGHMRNCAEENKGGWWYNGCYSSNINGLYHTGWYINTRHTFADGIVWHTLKDSEFYSLRRVEMKIRPLQLG